MRYYIRDSHPINIMDGDKIDKKIQFWLSKWFLGECSHVCVAIDNGKVIGFFRFDIEKKILWASGTWVSNSFRGKGIAKNMWDRAIKFANPNKIVVIVTTNGGLKLVKKVKNQYSKIKIDCNNRSNYGH